MSLSYNPDMKKSTTIHTLAAFVVISLTLPGVFAGSDPKIPKEPARLDLRVAPSTVSPGSEVTVTLRIKAKSGININQYPKISLKVAEVAGVTAAGLVTRGNDAPPPPERLKENYFKTIDPLVLKLTLDPKVKPGKHEIQAKLKYFYCVAASGFCAPFKTDLTISVTVK